MIFLLIFWEFFKVGLFAIGGGLATIPFLFELSEKYGWFSKEEIMNYLAISQSLPGAVGINVSTLAGMHTAGFWGGVVAATALVLPAIIVILLVARFYKQYQCNLTVQKVMSGIRITILVLIASVTYEVSVGSLKDITSILMLVILTSLVFWLKKSPVFYIIISAVAGTILF